MASLIGQTISSLCPIPPAHSSNSIFAPPQKSASANSSSFFSLSISSITWVPSSAFAKQGGFLVDGKLPRASRALLADAFGTIFGALTGTSTVTSYIESAAGVAAGARTGLGNLVIAALFLLAMFCAPLIAAIPVYATAPALILVGALMCGSIARIQWNDFSEAFPAFLTLVATPLTFSIATGLSLGLLSFTFIKVGTGKYREISPLIWILSGLFLLRYAFLGSE